MSYLNTSATISNIGISSTFMVALIATGSHLLVTTSQISSSSQHPLFTANHAHLCLSNVNMLTSLSPSFVSSDIGSSVVLMHSTFNHIVTKSGNLVLRGMAEKDTINNCFFGNISMQTRSQPTVTINCIIQDSVMKDVENGIYGGIASMKDGAFGMLNCTVISNFRDITKESRRTNNTICTDTVTTYCSTETQIVLSEDKSYSFQHCTFEYCSGSGFGGAISWEGDESSFLNMLSIQQCTFLHCETPDDYGGAVFCSYCSIFRLTTSNFSFCTSDAEAGAAAAVDIVIACAVSSCHFSNCSAGLDGGAIIVARIPDTTNPACLNCSFISCLTQYNPDIPGDEDVSFGGGFAFFPACIQTVSQCLFKNCSTYFYGGGLYWDSFSTGSAVSECVFQNNTASLGGHDAAFTSCSSNPFADCSCTLTNRNNRVITLDPSGGYTQHDDWLPYFKEAPVCGSFTEECDADLLGQSSPYCYISPSAKQNTACGSQTTPCATLSDLSVSSYYAEQCTSACIVLAATGEEHPEQNVSTFSNPFTLSPCKMESPITFTFKVSLNLSDTTIKSFFTIDAAIAFQDIQFNVLSLSSPEELSPSLFKITSDGSLTLTYTIIQYTGPSDTCLYAPLIDATEGGLTLKGATFDSFSLYDHPLIAASPSLTVEEHKIGDGDDAVTVKNTFQSITRTGGNGTVFAIDITSSSVIYLTNAQFDTCTLSHTQSMGGFGGAIYLNVTSMAGSLTLTDLEFSSITIPSDGGGTYIYAYLASTPTGTASDHKCSSISTWTEIIPSVLDDYYFDNIYVFEDRSIAKNSSRHPLRNFYELYSHKFVGTKYYTTTIPDTKLSGTKYYPIETLSLALQQSPPRIFMLDGDNTTSSTTTSVTSDVIIAGVESSSSSLSWPIILASTASGTATDLQINRGTTTLCRIHVLPSSTLSRPIISVSAGAVLKMLSTLVDGQPDSSSSSVLSVAGTLTLQKTTIRSFTLTNNPLISLSGALKDCCDSTISSISRTDTSTNKATGSVIALVASSGSYDISGITFQSCSSEGWGGAVSISASGSANISIGTTAETKFIGCTTSYYDSNIPTYSGGGGALYVSLTGNVNFTLGPAVYDGSSSSEGETSASLSFDASNTLSTSSTEQSVAQGGAIFISITGVSPTLHLNEVSFPTSGDTWRTNIKGYCLFVTVDNAAWVNNVEKYTAWKTFGDLLPSDVDSEDPAYGTPSFNTIQAYMIRYPGFAATQNDDLHNIPLNKITVDDYGAIACTQTENKCPKLSLVVNSLNAYSTQNSPEIYFMISPEVEKTSITISCKTSVLLEGNAQQFRMEQLAESTADLITIGGACTGSTSTNITVTIRNLTFNTQPQERALMEPDRTIPQNLFSVSTGATLILTKVGMSCISLPWYGESRSPLHNKPAFNLATGSRLIINSSSTFNGLEFNHTSLISATGTAKVELSSATFSNVWQNNTNTTFGGPVFSGTLKSGGELSVDNCIFTDCHAYGGNGGAMNINIDGGIVNFAQQQSVTFTTCHADMNATAYNAPSPLRPAERVGGSGGALYITISSGTLNLGADVDNDDDDDTTLPNLKFDSCYADSQVGFGGSIFISHTSSTPKISFGKHQYVTSSRTGIATQGTFVYFVSSVSGYVTESGSDCFRDLLWNSEFDENDVATNGDNPLFNVLDAFVAYDASANQTYQMYMIGSTGETLIYPSSVSTDQRFCGVAYPCRTLHGAITYMSEFIKKPTSIHIKSNGSSDTPTLYSITTAGQSFYSDITIIGEDTIVESIEGTSQEKTKNQVLTVSVSGTSYSSVFIISAAVTFKEITFKITRLSIPLFTTTTNGTLILNDISFIPGGSSNTFEFTSPLIDASLTSLTLTSCSFNFTQFTMKAGVTLIKAATLADHTDTIFVSPSSSSSSSVFLSIATPEDSSATEVTPSETTRTVSSMDVTATDATALYLRLTGENAAIQSCTLTQANKQDDAPALVVDVQTGTATLEDLTFKYQPEVDAQHGCALSLSVINGSAALTGCKFYNFVASYTFPLEISVKAREKSPLDGKLDISNCEFQGCYYKYSELQSITVTNAPTTITNCTFITLAYVEPTEDDDTVESQTSSSESLPEPPTQTGGAISITSTNSSITVCEGCSFAYFMSSPIAIYIQDPVPDDPTKFISPSVALIFNGLTFSSCHGASGSGLAIDTSDNSNILLTSTSLTITDCLFTDCYRTGSLSGETVYVSVEGLSAVLIQNNTFKVQRDEIVDEFTQETLYTYEQTGRAITLETDSCTTLSLKENTFEYFTTLSDGSAVLIQNYSSGSYCNVSELTFEKNTFTTGTSYSSDDISPAMFVSVQRLAGSTVLFESNTFSAYRQEQVGTPLTCGGGISLSYTPVNTNGSITFHNNNFTGMYSSSSSGAILLGIEAGTESTCLPSITLTQINCINCTTTSSGHAIKLTGPSTTAFTIGRVAIANCTFLNCYTADSAGIDAVTVGLTNVSQLIVSDNTFVNTHTIKKTICCFPSANSAEPTQSSTQTSTQTSTQSTETSEGTSEEEEEEEEEGETVYPHTGRALKLSIENCKQLTISKNTFDSFTSSDTASTLIITASTTSCTIDDLKFTENSFSTGTSDAANIPAVSVAITDLSITSALFDSNIFLFASAESSDSTLGCEGGLSLTVRQNTQIKNASSFTFINNIFTGFSSTTSSSTFNGAAFIAAFTIPQFILQNNSFINCHFKGTGNHPGGLYLMLLDTTADLKQTFFTQCSSSTAGGGLYIYAKNTSAIFTDATFYSCESSGYGGSVYLVCDESNITFGSTDTEQTTTDSSESASSTNVQSGFFYNSTAANGGAVYITRNLTSPAYPDSIISFTSQVFDLCSANKSGGAISAEVNNFQINIHNSTFTNTATYEHGAVHLDVDNSVVYITSTAFTNCTAKRRGGAVFIENMDTPTLTDGDFFGDLLSDTTLEPVRAAHVFISSVAVQNCSVTADSSGGGMCVLLKNGSFSLADSTFASCTSTHNGGGIYLYVDTNTTANVSNTNFSLCTASHNGGGALLGLFDGTLEIAGCAFSGCSAQANGGGIYLGMTTGKLSLVPAVVWSERLTAVKLPLSFDNCTAGVTKSRAANNEMANAASGCGGAMYMQVTATILATPIKRTIGSEESQSIEVITDNSENMTFLFNDVQIKNSNALKGNALYISTNLQSILEKDAWNDLLGSDANPADFVYSVVNVTEPLTDLSMLDNTSYTDSLHYDSDSQSTAKSSNTTTIIVVVVVLVVVIVVVLVVLLFLYFRLLRHHKDVFPDGQEKDMENMESTANNPESTEQTVSSPPETTDSPPISSSPISSAPTPVSFSPPPSD